MHRKIALVSLLGLAVVSLCGPVAAQRPEAQIVAIDACDPTTFNAALGPNFCLNVSLAALGQAVALSDLFAQAAAGTPNPGWDFAPDTVTIHQGGTVSVVNEGGEPHTFTEVQQFGGGFITGLNDGQKTVPECSNGFSNPKVALTRVLQGSQIHVSNLSQGTHNFMCCIHPWMRTQVIVK